MFPIKKHEQISIPFGYSNDNLNFHSTVSFKCKPNTKVYAVAEGKVIFNGPVPGIGGVDPSRFGVVLAIQNWDYASIYFGIQRVENTTGYFKHGEYIGRTSNFYSGNEELSIFDFGIHLGYGIHYKLNNWVYRENIFGWVDPIKFLNNI